MTSDSRLATSRILEQQKILGTVDMVSRQLEAKTVLTRSSWLNDMFMI